MNNFLLGQPWALKLVWAVNVQNYTILPGTLPSAPARARHAGAYPAWPAPGGASACVGRAVWQRWLQCLSGIVVHAQTVPHGPLAPLIGSAGAARRTPER